jgi:rhodanese-related sulfurtransferase
LICGFGQFDLPIRMPGGKSMTTHVTETAAALSEIAVKHFEEMLAFETDCWDVHESLKSATPDFIVVDVRGRDAFAKGHVKGAINIPHREITDARMAEYPKGKIFVVYCAGPNCNGANKAALRLARLGLPLKMMIGGVTGWIDEGFTLTPS